MTNTKGGNLALVFIMVTVALDSAGLGIIIPIMPKLIAELASTDISGAAKLGGLLTVSYAVMQFLFGPILGNLGDRFGRRPVLLVSLIVMAVDYIIMALAPTLIILFVGRIIAGIAGATFSTANAFIADISDPAKRSANFGLVGAAFGIGFIIGPAVGGLLSDFGLRAPFFAAAGVAFLNFCFGMFVLKESLPIEKRRPFLFSRANPLGALKQLSKFPNLKFLFFVFFLFTIAHWVYPAIWAYFTELEQGIGWSAKQSGFSLALFGVASAFVQGYLIRRIITKVGDAKTAYYGLIANLFSMLFLAFVSEGIYIYLMLPLIAMGAIMTPALNGLMSNMVPNDAQGELQGALASVQGIATILSTLLMTQLFSLFTGGSLDIFFPGAPFFVAACLVALCFIPLRKGIRS